ncbi:MAG: M48 family metallopeptidase [Alphaproteobacteria bacterium]|nr:M48 family metallopeptidase [Alphaproteobacteria bacterium]
MKITLLTGQIFNFSNKFPFKIKIIKSLKAKKLILRIDEKLHCAVLTIPKTCSQKQALLFLDSNKDWITNMMAHLPQNTHFFDGAELSFWNKKYTIQHNPLLRGSCFENNLLKIGGNIEFLHRRTTDFLKQQALKLLSQLTIEKAKQLDVKVNTISVKDTKSRWGSCSTRGNINYNWRISMAPLYVIEYLVCHEVSHLKHPDHSTNFWHTLESICPNYKEGKQWLKIKGKTLYNYI